MPGLLYNSPCDVLRALLVGMGKNAITLPSGAVIPAGLVTDPTLVPIQAWPCWADGEYDTPDSAVFVKDTQGRMDGRSMIDGEYYEHFGVQVSVRSVTPRAGFKKARQIAVALDQAVVNASVSIVDPDTGTTHNYTIPCVSRTSGPMNIGKETPSTKRNHCTINFVFPIGELT